MDGGDTSSKDGFAAFVAESDGHFLETARYIALNPVRAGICERPEEWPWSSYRAAIGDADPPSFLFLDDLLRYFGTNRIRAAARLRRFVESALPR